jgi:uncharacterized membrane protein
MLQLEDRQRPVFMSRYSAIDALRGLIMMIMAIDHASAFIARQHASEFWAGAMSSYTAAFPFLTRWITHLCAPGFFFLMGAGLYWFAASRQAAGWTEAMTMRRIVGRGAALFVIAQLLETPLLYLPRSLTPAATSLNKITAPPPMDGTALYGGMIVLSALGLAMIACGLLLRLPPVLWLAASALCVWATNSLLPASGQPGPWWQALLLSPGLSQHIFYSYPVLPWLAGAAAGLYFGYWWRSNPEEAARRVVWLGAALLIMGIALRGLGGWGNIRLPRDSGWIEFLNNVKYPPSLVFWCMSLGIDLLLLAILLKLPAVWKAERSPLIVFGQTPLFFYLAHLYLLLACGYFFFPTAASLELTYVVWVLALAALYPVCLRYRAFKLSRPAESFWRMF